MDNRIIEAVNYITQNPTLSFHHVSVKFGVNVSLLQKKYRENLVNRSKKVGEKCEVTNN